LFVTVCYNDHHMLHLLLTLDTLLQSLSPQLPLSSSVTPDTGHKLTALPSSAKEREENGVRKPAFAPAVSSLTVWYHRTLQPSKIILWANAQTTLMS